MVNCQKCHKPNPEGAKFCKHCGATISKTDKTLRCPNGHILDPSWEHCPQCPDEPGKKSEEPKKQQVDAGGEGTARRKTKAEPQGGGVKPPRKPTDIEPETQEEPKKKRPKRLTNVAPYGDETESQPGQSETKRLVGFLVTYSIDPMGQYFEIREGKHIIGSGDDADISVPDDDRMSSEHATLLFRRGKFWFDDTMSTNGSFVNGEEVDEKITLGNYDEIKLGETVFRLIIAEPKESKKD